MMLFVAEAQMNIVFSQQMLYEKWSTYFWIQKPGYFQALAFEGSAEVFLKDEDEDESFLWASAFPRN